MSDEEDATTSPQRFVRAIARGFAVLECLGTQPLGLTSSEIARGLDLDRGTVRRILLTLIQLRYVRQSDDRFHVAPRVMRLGYGFLSSLPFWELLNPVMEELVKDLKENASAAILDDNEILFVAGVKSPLRGIEVARPPGNRLPVYWTSLGRVLVAFQSPEVRHSILNAMPETRHTQFTITDRMKLEAELNKVAIQGWALVDQELHLGFRTLAVPVRCNGVVVAAINVLVMAQRVSIEDLLSSHLPRLQSAASEIGSVWQHSRNH